MRNFFSISSSRSSSVVLGLPIAERHAQRIQKRAVRIDAVLVSVCIRIGQKNQIARLAPILEEGLERLGDYDSRAPARHLAQRLQIVQVVLDEKLAQWHGQFEAGVARANLPVVAR